MPRHIWSIGYIRYPNREGIIPVNKVQDLLVDHFIEHLVEGSEPSAQEKAAYKVWQCELRANKIAKELAETPVYWETRWGL
jgi:hypothetical protein